MSDLRDFDRNAAIPERSANDLTDGDLAGDVQARDVHPEEIFARLQAQTRRHFLRSLTAGVGTMFLEVSPRNMPAPSTPPNSTLMARRASISSATLLIRSLLYPRNLRLTPSASFICTWRARPANWNSSITNRS